LKISMEENKTVSVSDADNTKTFSGDDVLLEMKAMLRQCLDEGNSLAPGLKRITERYGKLLKRFNKVVSISDSYQSQLMELKARLEVVARTDLLTGLANRREIMNRLESERYRAERYGTIFSLLIGDLDHFKSINDSFGHLAGDMTLKMVSETLQSILRVGDCCGRWGGEEFMIILPETDLQKACLVAAKLISGISEAKIYWERETISVSMSFGVGSYTLGLSIDEYIKQVDDALYAAKAGGRNCFQLVQGQLA